MEPSTRASLVKLNRAFMTICAHWASVNTELDLPVGATLLFIDRLTLLWSFVIITTTIIKCFKLIDYWNSQASITSTISIHSTELQQLDEILWKDVLTLNYLPNIHDFGKLYYGLIWISIGSALSWRLYLDFYRPRQCRIRISRSRPELFNAKHELINFFMGGPIKTMSANRAINHLILNCRRHANAFEKCISARHCASNLVARVQSSLQPPKLPKQAGLLGRMHEKRISFKDLPPNTWRNNHHRWSRQSKDLAQSYWANTGGPIVIQYYKVPIRAVDFLRDCTEERWLFLVKRVYLFCLLALVLSMPILWYLTIGIETIMQKFTSSKQGMIDKAMNVYGTLELVYTITQAAMFFVFTNIFLTLFHADLVFKFKPIRHEIEIISKLYQHGKVVQLQKEEVHRQQLRLWSYFDYVNLLDDYVSVYAIVSMTVLILGLSFGQSYIKIDEPTLKMGTLSALLSNFLSFTYLHLASWNIEQKVS